MLLLSMRSISSVLRCPNFVWNTTVHFVQFLIQTLTYLTRVPYMGEVIGFIASLPDIISVKPQASAFWRVLFQFVFG